MLHLWTHCRNETEYPGDTPATAITKVAQNKPKTPTGAGYTAPSFSVHARGLALPATVTRGEVRRPITLQPSLDWPPGVWPLTLTRVHEFLLLFLSGAMRTDEEKRHPARTHGVLQCSGVCSPALCRHTRTHCCCLSLLLQK